MERTEFELGFHVGRVVANLEHRVSELEKVLKVDLAKLAKDLTADAAVTDAATKANPVPQS